MEDAQGKETMNRILELEQRVALLEKEIASLKGEQASMKDVEKSMQLNFIVSELLKGNKEPLREHNRNYKLLHPDSKKRSKP